MYMYLSIQGLPDTLWTLMFSRRATAGHQPGHGGRGPEKNNRSTDKINYEEQ